MYAMGFSLNLLTLLALVLAVGLVVDDAIVMLENIYRRIEDGEQPIHAGSHLGRALPLRASIVEHQPAGSLLLNLGTGEPFVGPVVPLQQIGIAAEAAAKSSQFGRALRPLQRAGEHLGEVHPRQQGLQPSGGSLPCRGEGDVGAAGVLSGSTPGGFTVAHQHHIGGLKP
jgi:hypothetical protein